MNRLGSIVRDLIWVGSSLKDLKSFPEDLRKSFGFALDQAQRGGKHLHAKPLKGFSGIGVMEILEDFKGDTYRVIYSLRCKGIVYVLHAFQKKSKSGIATSKKDIDLIYSRLKLAEADYEKRIGSRHEKK